MEFCISSVGVLVRYWIQEPEVQGSNPSKILNFWKMALNSDDTYESSALCIRDLSMI